MALSRFTFSHSLLGVALLSSLALGTWYWKPYRSTASRPDASPEQAPRAAQQNAPLPLDPDERAYLWQIEHHGLLLGKHGFRPLAEALRQADAPGLQRLLAADFTGSTLHQPREVRLDTRYAQVVRQQDSGAPPERLSASQFLEQLLSYRRLFRQTPNVALSLMALAPLVRHQLEGRWQGTCLLRLWGEREPGKPSELLVSLAYEIAQPTEPNLASGSWLYACRIEQIHIAHAPHFLMRDATAERGIDASLLHDNWRPGTPSRTNSGGVYLCDFDRDGILDLLLVDCQRLALYKGLPGGRFLDVTARMGLPTRSPAGQDRPAVFVDLDGDGWEDLLLGDRLYRNDGGTYFVDVTGRSNFRLPADAIAVVVADYDRDGRVDLYVTRSGKMTAGSWIDGKSEDADGNHLWRNLGDWQFEDVTVRSGTGGGHRSTFSAVWLDANNDGWPDLFVINEFGAGVLLLNRQDGTFREVQLTDGASDFGSMGITCGDIDNDGNIDLYVANMYSKAGNRVIGNLKAGAYPDAILEKMRHFVSGSQMYRNLGVHGATVPGTPTFEPVGRKRQVAAVGWAFGAALVDLDNDGWLDLYATAGFISRSRSEPDG
jgi:hypothetical protein